MAALASLAQVCASTPKLVDDALDAFDPRRATRAVWAIVDEANRCIERTRPWSLARDGADHELDAALATLLAACQTLASELAPSSRTPRPASPPSATRPPAPVARSPRPALSSRAWLIAGRGPADGAWASHGPPDATPGVPGLTRVPGPARTAGRHPGRPTVREGADAVRRLRPCGGGCSG